MELKKYNVHYLPGADGVSSEHRARAAELKPSGLLPGAGDIWDRLAPEMMLLGRLKNHFVDAFAEYCYLLNRLAETRRLLSDIGETYEVFGRNGNQRKSRPEIAQLNDDWRKLQRLSGCFGLTPADEKTLINSIQQNLIDEFAEFK